MILNRQDTAAAMGVHTTTIDRWVREGCPVQKRGRPGVAAEFNMPDVFAWWCAREAANAEAAEPGDLAELKLRKLAAQAGLAELELAKVQGEVGSIAEWERDVARTMATIQVNVLNVPNRAVLQLLGETDAVRFQEVLNAELALALEQSTGEALEPDEGEEFEWGESDDDD